MREIKILDWCDMCMATDETHVAADQKVTFGLVSGEGRPSLNVLDLCDMHLNTINETMKPWQQIARPLDAPNNVASGISRRPAVQLDDRQHCTLCDKSYTQRQGLIGHTWRIHRGQEPPPQPGTCPTCHERFEAPGMTMHRISAHGYDALKEALKGAR